MDLDIKFPPTISAFMRSNARTRLILGPFGCLPASTQFLTARGWVRMDQYAGQRVAQWDQRTQRITWTKPRNYIRADCKEFIRFDSGGLTMELSPEHRVPYWNWNGKFDVTTAELMEQCPSKRIIPTTFAGPDTSGLDMPDALIRFAVMMHADGHYPPRGKQAMVTVRKDRKKARIRETLIALGVEWKEHVYSQRPTESIFSFVPPYTGKHFGPEWYAANARQLGIVAEEVAHWDGGVYGPEGKPEYRYFTVHKGDADFVQYACHASGRRAVLGFQQPRPNEKVCWVVHMRRLGSAKNVASVRGDHTKITRVPSKDGLKYCFTVPTGFFVARCENNIFVTGNSGKSVGSQIEIPRRASEQRPSTLNGRRKSRIAVVRNTMPQLRDTTLKTWMDWFPNGSLGHYVSTGKTYYIKHGDIDCEVVFRALDDEADVRNLLSLELTAAYVNEFKDIQRPIMEALDGRIGRYPRMNEGGPSWIGIWGDSNMPDEDTYWHSMLEGLDPDDPRKKRANEWEKFVQPTGMLRLQDGTYIDNPAAENSENLPPNYYANLIKGKTDDFIRTFVMCQYGRSRGGKPVHPMFDRDRHVSKQPLIPDPHNLLLVSADFGMTPAITLKQQNAFGQVLTLDEIVEFGTGIEQAIENKLLPMLRNRFDGFDVFVTGDPSGGNGSQNDASSCVDVFQRYRKKGLGRVKLAWSNSPVHRIAATDHFLSRNGDGGKPMYLVDPRCTWLIQALGGKFMFKKYKDGRESSEVDKNDWSHVGEANQYGDMYFERGGRRKAEQEDRARRPPPPPPPNHYNSPR